MPISSARRLSRRQLDARLATFTRNTPERPPSQGWLKTIRGALGMSAAQLAARLGIARQSLDDMETSEAAGTITLNTLRRAADALDCDLVYVLVPRTSLEQTVTDRTRALAARDLARTGQTMALEDQSNSPEVEAELLDDYAREHIREKDIWSLP